jgi:hypothetical protein
MHAVVRYEDDPVFPYTMNGESETAEGFVWELKHGLYGLKYGARQFYMSVRDELLSLGFRQLKLDPAMFTLIREGSLIRIICCHVDGFLHAGNETFLVHSYKTVLLHT